MRYVKYLFVSILPCLVTVSYALPFNIVPIGALPTTVPQGGTVGATYGITNITQFNPPSNFIKWLPTNVTINPIGTTCTPTNAFKLAPGQTCRLALTISGAVNSADPNPEHHLFVCMSDSVTCAGPSPQNSLNVTVVPPSVASTHLVTVGVYGWPTNPISYISDDLGKNWTLSTSLPVPQGSESQLNSVACSANGKQCVAVGNYSSTNYESLIYSSSNGGDSWAQSTINRVIVSPVDTTLFGVACSADGQQCIAVGLSIDHAHRVSANNPISLITTDGGANWNSTGGGLSSPGGLFSISCDSTGLICAAVGETLNNSGNYLGWNTTDGGSHWNLSAFPPPLTGSTENPVNSVACDSSGLKCASVGASYDGVSYTPLSYYTTDGGINWTFSTTLPPSQGSNDNILTGVACDSSGQKCSAVGYFNNGSVNQPLSYYTTDAGVNWTKSMTLPPSQSSQDYFLMSIKCDTTGQNCSAVGYFDNFGTQTPLSYITTDGGKNWAASTTMPAVQSGSTELNGVG